MKNTPKLAKGGLRNGTALLQETTHAADALQADAYRLAFSDTEFMLRRETRGIRIQLEMLKPDLDQTEQGVNDTVVVFGRPGASAGRGCSACSAGAVCTVVGAGGRSLEDSSESPAPSGKPLVTIWHGHC